MNIKRIGYNVSVIRNEKGLTQEKLAELSGVSPEHISHIERGKAGMSLSLLLDFCHYLSVTPNDILSGEFETVSPKDRIENYLEGYYGLTKKDKKLLQNIIDIVLNDYLLTK